MKLDLNGAVVDVAGGVGVLRIADHRQRVLERKHLALNPTASCMRRCTCKLATFGTHRTVKARSWPWPSGLNLQNVFRQRSLKPYQWFPSRTAADLNGAVVDVAGGVGVARTADHRERDL
jgi:hypothetical protein